MTHISLVQILIALIGTSGLGGAIAAFIKVRPERQTAAISQATGAMEAMSQLNEALRRELERQQEINEEQDVACEEYKQRLVEATRMIAQMQQIMHGMMMMEEEAVANALRSAATRTRSTDVQPPSSQSGAPPSSSPK